MIFNPNEFLKYFLSLPQPAHKASWIAVRENMIIHTQGLNPMDVIIRRHTREDFECYDWRKQNICVITEPVIRRAISRLTTILNDSGYSYECSPELDNELNQRNFLGNSFWVFFRHNILQDMIEDPNGFLVWQPENTINNKTKEAKFTVKPILVISEKVCFFDPDNLIFESAIEKSLVFKYDKDVYEGIVFYWHTNYGIFRIKQVGDFYKDIYEIEEYYIHNFGFNTYLQLGGDWISCDYYKSYFNAFVPFANEALKQFSDWQVIMASCAYPIKEVTQVACEVSGCMNGKLEDNSTCKSCNGTGYKSYSGPFSLLIRPEKSALDESGVDTRPMLSYITPPTDILVHSREAWEKLLQRAEDALNLSFVREPQSGIAKDIDRQDMYAMLENIGANVYDNLMQYSLKFLEYYYRKIWGGKIIEPTVNKPVSYGIKTEKELQDDYNTFIKDGVSVSFAQRTAFELAGRKFGSDGVQARIVDFLGYYDPLDSDTAQSIQAKMSSGSVTLIDAIRHARAYWAVKQILADKTKGSKWLMDADYAIIAQTCDAIIAPFFPNLIPDVVPNN